MRSALASAALAALLSTAAAAGLALPAQAQTRAAPAGRLKVETQSFTLSNGLKVVMSRDTSIPTATVGVYYGIGFRIEPRERTGFAHLFEHLMFQGSEHAPKGQFIGTITNAGGSLNGSTRFDYTNYYEVVPTNALERVLWLEADRMARPVINETVLKNQQGVVGNEVKVNVLNRPYGGWPWIDLPMAANTNWYNAHNFYGDLKEIEAATVDDATQFFKSFYRPNNAVLVVLGDIDYAQTRAMITRYFGGIPSGAAVTLPDISEPRQTEEKVSSRLDKLAPKPGYAIGYHVPKRGTPEWYAMGLLDQILAQGEDSRLHQKLVKEKAVTGSVDAGINIGLGNMFNYNGPMLWTVSFTHDADRKREEITAAVDEVITDIQNRPISTEELERARTKMRSDLYAMLDSSTRFGLVDLIASYALFDGDAGAVNRIEDGFAKVTPQLIQATAREYLRPTNRTFALIEAGAGAQTGAAK
ncbi:insulinase family protein [Phenylobacterium deserti]|uniref:Insulinase family protein n=2 Tax=Phenylobacterium deserti TaxID=1914756 RepID=A0A328AUJ9_9CAUL|nr:insulinase family protein [Phenylobacterium deserti]